MKLIAVTIESTRAVFYSIEVQENGTIKKIAEDMKSISISDDYNNAELKTFKEKAYAFFNSVAPDRIAIVKRMTKGKFAAGSVSFKLEAIIQCYEACEVEFVSPASLKAFYKKNTFNQMPSHKYQLQAAQLAQFLIS